MKNNKMYEQRVAKTKQLLKSHNIDAYIIKTKEGCDKTVENIFGYAVVGEAYMIITQDHCYAIASVIDAQDSEESGLFSEVIKYSKEGVNSVLLTLLNKILPKKIAINVSKNNPKSDGFTVGSYRQFIKMIEEIECDIISSEIFIDEIF